MKIELTKDQISTMIDALTIAMLDTHQRAQQTKDMIKSSNIDMYSILQKEELDISNYSSLLSLMMQKYQENE